MPKKFRTSKDKSGSAYVHPIGTAPKGAKVSPPIQSASKPSRPVADFRKFAKGKGITASKTKATREDVAKIHRTSTSASSDTVKMNRSRADPIADFREFARLKGIGPTHHQATAGDVAKIPRPNIGGMGTMSGEGSWEKGYFIKRDKPTGMRHGTFTEKWDKKNPPRHMVKKGELAVFANTGRTGKKKYVILSKEKALSMVRDTQSKTVYNRFHKRVSVKEHSTYVPWEIHTSDTGLLKLFGV
jgi:hypothetical protein